MSPSRATILPVSLLVLLLAGCQPTTVAPTPEPPTTAPATPVAAGTKPAYPETVSYGKKIDLAKLALPGKTTIFDFSSPYCPPCQEIAPHMADLHMNREDLAVVTVNINRPEIKGIDWDSPVARQFGLNSIPHFVIYGPDGSKQLDGDMARDQVMSWLKG